MIHFKRISNYCIQLQDYTIAKIKVHEVFIYEVWHMNKYIKKFTDPDEAKKYVLNIVKGY